MQQQKNRIEVTGYLTARPALRHLPSGTPVANVRLGESYPYLSQGKVEQHTNWHSLSFYGDLATLHSPSIKATTCLLRAAWSNGNSRRPTAANGSSGS